MKRKDERVPGFDEIIFSDRNKEYGAYKIRKNYNATMGISLLGGIALAIILVVLPSLTVPKDSAKYTEETTIVEFTPDLEKALNVEQPDQPKPPEGIILKNSYAPPEIVSDTSALTNPLLSFDEMNDGAKDGAAVEIPESYDEAADPIVEEEPEPRVFVQEMPEFPGGEPALMKYISDNLIYPAEAVENGVEGKVTLRFVVASTGAVERITVVKSTGSAIDLSILENEAVRVISTMPLWRPGKQDGNPVPVYFTVPVTFKIKR